MNELISVFLCYRCGEYCSKYKKNIIYHVNKKYKCKENIICDNFDILSMNIIYEFKNNDVFLSYNYNFIDLIKFNINKYINEQKITKIFINKKDKNKKNKKDNSNNKINNNLYNQINYYLDNKITDNSNNEINDTSNNEINDNSNNEINNNSNNEINDNSNNEINNNSKIKNNIALQFLNDNGLYECPNCNNTYTTFQNCKLHMNNIDKCNEIKQMKIISNYYLKTKDKSVMSVGTQTDNSYLQDENKNKSYSNICIGTDDINYNESQYYNNLQLCLADIQQFYKNYTFDYNISNYNDVEEYNYMIQRAIDVGTNIVKIGMSRNKKGDLRRISQYEKGYKILITKASKDSRKTEIDIINHFKLYFKPRPDIGKEYFEGNIKEMEIAFFTIACKN